MLNKNVCPNCGQLYDTELERCPLCGTAPQVVEVDAPVQRRRITEAERRQRRADRKEAEQEAKRRRKDEQLLRDAEEERLLEEAQKARREEKRRKKQEKKGVRPAAEEAEPAAESEPVPVPVPVPVLTPTPATVKRAAAPRPSRPAKRKGRVPRGFLVLCVLLLLVALVVGGSYLLWKTKLVSLPIYDELMAKYAVAEETVPVETEPPAPTTEPVVECASLTLSTNELKFTAAGDSDQIVATVLPENCTQTVQFVSGDEAVCKVGATGVVTAAGPGTAVISVTCGSKTAECTVICELPETTEAETEADAGEPLQLRSTDITFFEAGENFVILVENLPAGTEVTWTSDDESIATVDNSGHVVAVGKGTTNVTAHVGNRSASCIVRCNFRDEDGG